MAKVTVMNDDLSGCERVVVTLDHDTWGKPKIWTSTVFGFRTFTARDTYLVTREGEKVVRVKQECTRTGTRTYNVRELDWFNFLRAAEKIADEQSISSCHVPPSPGIRMVCKNGDLG